MKKIFEEMDSLDVLSFLRPENLQKVMEKFERVQQDACLLLQGDKNRNLIRVGTVLTFGLVEIILHGKSVSQLTGEEWGKIADRLVVYGIEMPDDQYSAFIFEMYAHYLSLSVQGLRTRTVEGKMNGDNLDAIDQIIEKIQKDTEDFREGRLGEADYIERNLWNCLEAIMKLLSAWLQLPGGREINAVKDAAVAFAFYYAKMTIYKNQQAYLEELEKIRSASEAGYQEKYDAFVKEMKQRASQFEELLDRAFDEDFSERLHGSVELARSADVAENEILHSVEEVDDFFMN